jgi:tRNA C32,U32 (ribose-2'-O)-methylase TrmJ
MICCHEIYVASGEFENAAYEWTPDAPSEFRERMFRMWRQTMLDVGFMKEDKAQHMMMGLRRILSRGKLTISDVKILMGIARQTQWFVGYARKLQDQDKRPLDNPPEPDLDDLSELPPRS